jgi:Periplasmic binding protein-like domain
MSNALERKSLPVRLADLIEDELKAGKWGSTLAGHRTLMDRYSVSAKTCLAAIDLLEARGLISCAQQGRKRRVLVTPNNVAGSLTDLLIIDGMGSQSGEDILQLQAYRRVWEEIGGRVHSIKFDFPRYRRPSTLIREAIASHKADALLLHVAPLAWVEAAQRLRPVFLAGGEWKGGGITGVGYDVREEVIRAVGKLREFGHSRIVVPMDLVGSGMEKAVREGLARGLGLRDDSPVVRELSPVFPERVPSVWQSYWKKMISTLQPTAVILLDDIRYLSLSGYCFSKGIRIPHDLSVICLESTEHLEWCQPVPTRTRFPVEEAVRHFRKWIRGGCQATGMKFLPMELISGESVETLNSTPARRPRS